jgi:hypothetical protein
MPKKSGPLAAPSDSPVWTKPVTDAAAVRLSRTTAKWNRPVQAHPTT